MREIILKTNRLSKSYGSVKALDSVDMTVYQGDIYGLIGRNGAGKTTILKIVSGLIASYKGNFSLFSKTGEVTEYDKKRLGCLIENPAFFMNLTVFENLKYYAIQKGIADKKQINHVLELLNLTEQKKKKYKQLSFGMKQRLGIAFAILDNPDLLILDEPINGIDPTGISKLRNIFEKLNREYGTTIIISSHILSELYVCANRFLFIDKGRVLKEISKEELMAEIRRCIVIKTADVRQAAVLIEKTKGISDYHVTGYNEIKIYDDRIDMNGLAKMLLVNNIRINGIYEGGISLEDYFISLVEGL